MKQLFKLDENKNIRVWFMEQNGADYRTHSGVLNGKIVISGWKTAKAKNTGKKNGTTPEEQATLEIERKYRDQLDTGGYFETIELAQIGARTYFLPMLAEKYSDRKSNLTFPVYSQPKLDGARCLVQIDSIKTREGKVFVSVPHIHEQLKQILEANPSIVFDGELYNHELKNDFEKLISLVRKTKPEPEDLVESEQKIQYWIYDMYDRDDPHLTFAERLAKLQRLFSEYGLPKNIVLVQSPECFNETELDVFYEQYTEAGFEGQMVRADKPYEQKRSRSLLKRKEFLDSEYEIDHIEEGEGNWAGAAKRIYIKLPDGSVQRAGARGTYEYLKYIFDNKDAYVGDIVTVRFQGYTQDNKLRFPVVTIFWGKKREY